MDLTMQAEFRVDVEDADEATRDDVSSLALELVDGDLMGELVDELRRRLFDHTGEHAVDVQLRVELRPHVPWLVVEPGAWARCTRCGRTETPRMPCPLAALAAFTQYIEVLHEHCQEGETQ